MKPNELLELLLKSIVDLPQEVKVDILENQGHIILNVQVSSIDRKKQQFIEALDSLRIIMRAVGGKIETRIELNLVEY